MIGAGTIGAAAAEEEGTATICGGTTGVPEEVPGTTGGEGEGTIAT